MSDLLDRVRRALGPKLAVDRPLGGGGMGAVFLARHRTLDKLVAVKVLRPELASAEGVERFHREASILASFRHPHIVPVHDRGEADGLPYYEMDYLEGPTLADRLARGPLGPAGAQRIGRELLDALERVHARGVVHRDIKPGNIFLVDGETVLTDFGIAKSPPSDQTALTEPGQRIGTLAYMPPEQLAGGEVTPRTDLYALAMVLYQAATGRLWDPFGRRSAADWRGVPRRFAAALRRALKPAPEERFPDAAAFLRALERRPAPWVPATALAGGAVLVAALGYLAWRAVRPVAPRLPDLAVLPFETPPGPDPGLGTDLAYLAARSLEPLAPRLLVVPPNQAIAAVEQGGRPPARHVVTGRVAATGDSLAIFLLVRDSAGASVGEAVVRAAAGDAWRAAGAAAVRLLPLVRPDIVEPDLPRFTESPPALREFLEGEQAFRRDDWRAAEAHFRQAVAFDPGFALAAWRLWNVQRWRRIPKTVDLGALLAASSAALPRTDSLLVAAELAPHGAPRHARYEEAIAADPFDGYALLLYASELFHRGPLVGLSPDSGTTLARRAVALYPQLAPAHDQLVWGLIAEGRRDEARQALATLRRAPAGEETAAARRMLELAWLARFDTAGLGRTAPDWTAEMRAELFGRARVALAFDAPHAQLWLGRELARATDQPAARRASGHTAVGLALVALGRPGAALAHFDSAAALAATPTAALQAAQWRIVPAALGLDWVPAAELERGRRELERLAARSPVAGRAAWTLDLLAAGTGGETSAWRGPRPAPDPAGLRLAALAAARAAAALRRPREVLRLTEPLRVRDERTELADPFARAVLHVLRAEAHEALGAGSEAEREWWWVANTDFEGWLGAEQQAAEIDWAFGAYARARRGALALARGDRGTGCAALGRAVELWAGAEPALAAAAGEARRRLAVCPA